MQEFDFTKRDGANELSEMAEHLSHEEAAAAIAAIHEQEMKRKIPKQRTSKAGLTQLFFRF